MQSVHGYIMVGRIELVTPEQRQLLRKIADGPAADVELVRRGPEGPPRPRPAAVGLPQLIADLLGHPVLGPDHHGAERWVLANPETVSRSDR